MKMMDDKKVKFGKICLRFHMPAIFDSGWAPKILKVLKKYGDVESVVTGPMGATASLDNDIEKEVVFVKEGWSHWIKSTKYDVIVNATHSSLEKSLADCWHLHKGNIPLVGVETHSKTVVPWDESVAFFAESLSKDLNFNLGKPKDFGKNIWKEGDRTYRKILAVEPGDFVLIEGIVVGKAISENVVVVGDCGKIKNIMGVDIKKQGFEKVEKKNIPVEEMRINSVKMLRGLVLNRKKLTPIKKNRVAFINHAGYYIYNFIEDGAGAAVTVGDDTTLVTGDIMSRFSMPIIGLVDGDANCLLGNVVYAQNSVILYLEDDDTFGKAVFNEIFKRELLSEASFEEIKESIIDLAKKKKVLKEVEIQNTKKEQ